MRTAIFWVVAVLCLIFNGISLFDIVMTALNPAQHLAGYPPEFVNMVLGQPEWRRVMLTATSLIGVVGAIALVLRRALAERALWAAAVLLAAGIVADYVLLDGARGYGPNGIPFNAILIGIEALFAIYAGWARRQGMLR